MSSVLSQESVEPYLERGDFEEVARLLRRMQKALSDPVQAQVLAMAEQLCIVCTQLSLEADRHRQAQSEINHRLHHMAEQLRDMLKGVTPSAGSVQPLETSFWQRLRVMFNHRSQTRLHGRSAILQLPPAPIAHSEATLSVQSLGSFRVLYGLEVIGEWHSNKGPAIFKYLIAHYPNPVPKDHLMEAFWPDSEPETSRNRLNVALHALRQTLRRFSSLPVVLFRDGSYFLNPDLPLSLDIQAFAAHLHQAQTAEDSGGLEAAIQSYEAAIQLYQGDFLGDDLYEEWAIPLRERLNADYLETLHRLAYLYFESGVYARCSSICQRLLESDLCREDIHSLLMLCYSRLGQEHLALKQYQTCLEAFKRELDSQPSSTITELFEAIKRHEVV